MSFIWACWISIWAAIVIHIDNIREFCMEIVIDEIREHSGWVADSDVALSDSYYINQLS